MTLGPILLWVKIDASLSNFSSALITWVCWYNDAWWVKIEARFCPRDSTLAFWDQSTAVN